MCRLPRGVPREQRARRAVWQPVACALSSGNRAGSVERLEPFCVCQQSFLEAGKWVCQWEWAKSSSRWRIKVPAVFSSRSSRRGIRFWNQSRCFVMCLRRLYCRLVHQIDAFTSPCVWCDRKACAPTLTLRRIVKVQNKLNENIGREMVQPTS